jgi:hypothetical protein
MIKMKKEISETERVLRSGEPLLRHISSPCLHPNDEDSNLVFVTDDLSLISLDQFLLEIQSFLIRELGSDQNSQLWDEVRSSYRKLWPEEMVPIELVDPSIEMLITYIRSETGQLFHRNAHYSSAGSSTYQESRDSLKSGNGKIIKALKVLEGIEEDYMDLRFGIEDNLNDITSALKNLKTRNVTPSCLLPPYFEYNFYELAPYYLLLLKAWSTKTTSSNALCTLLQCLTDLLIPFGYQTDKVFTSLDKAPKKKYELLLSNFAQS